MQERGGGVQMGEGVGVGVGVTTQEQAELIREGLLAH